MLTKEVGDRGLGPKEPAAVVPVYVPPPINTRPPSSNLAIFSLHDNFASMQMATINVRITPARAATAAIRVLTAEQKLAQARCVLTILCAAGSQFAHSKFCEQHCTTENAGVLTILFTIIIGNIVCA